MRTHFGGEEVHLPATNAPYITIAHFYNTAIGRTEFLYIVEVHDMRFVYAYKLVVVQNFFKVFQGFGDHFFLQVFAVNNGIVTVGLQRNNICRI